MIYVGADHRGWELKARVNEWLAGRKYEFEDMGAYEHDMDDDYVDYAITVGERVGSGPEVHRGIVMCGSGVGVDMAANKEKGVP